MSLIVTLTVLFCIVLGAVLGALRGLWRTLYRTGLGLVCFGLSFIATLIASPKLSGALYDRVVPTLTLSDGKKLPDLLSLYPTTEMYAKNILGALTAIPLFLAALTVFSVVGYVFYLIFRKKIKPAKKTKWYLRVPSGVLGAAMGFLLITVILTPFAFLLSAAKPLLPLFPEEIRTDFVEKAVNETTDNPFARVSVSEPFLTLFDFYTEYDYKEAAHNLRTDVKTVTEIALSLRDLREIGRMGDREKQVKALGTLLDTVSGSPILMELYTEVLTVSANRLLADQDVLGLTYDGLLEKLPTLKALEPFPKELLRFFADTTVEQAHEDFALLSEFGDALVRSGLLSQEMNEETLLDSFRDPEKTASLIEPLLKYPRARALVSSMLGVGLRLVAEKTGLPADQNAVYAAIINEIGAMWDKTPDDKREGMVADILRKYKFDADNAVAAYLCAVLRNENTKTTDGETVARIFSESLEKRLGGSGLSDEQKTAVLRLSSADLFTSSSITTEKLLLYLARRTDGEKKNDPATEARFLGEVVASLGDVAKIFEESTDTVSAESIREIGGVITGLLKTDTVPKELVHDLAQGVIDLRLNTGFDAVKDLMLDSLIKEDGGRDFEQLIDTSAASYSVIESLTTDKPTDVKDVETLVRSITPRIANAVSESIDGSFFAARGLSENRAESCASLVHSILDHAASPVEKTDEALKTEAEALNYLFTFVQSASKNETTSIFDEGQTPEHLTETVLSSSIVSAAIRDTCRGEGDEMIMDPLALSPLLLEEERIGIRKALKERMQDADEEEKQTLRCLASMLLNEKLK